MEATFIPKADIRPGHRTVLGTVTEVKPSPSGKTIVITVKNERDGHLFTDRVSAVGGMAIFTETAAVIRYADAIMKAIDEDIAAGYVPAGIASFSALHDHVDANMYVIDVMQGDFPEPDEDAEILFSDKETDAANAAMDEVDRRLAARVRIEA